MPTEASTQIRSDDLAQIVQAVFETTMNLEAFEAQSPRLPLRERLVASVELKGGWNGEVLVECGAPQACRFAGHFLGTATPACADSVVLDVLGELANVIGGNLKSMLARGIQLSLPSVAAARPDGPRVGAAEFATTLAFRCKEGPFWVTVLAGT